MMRERQLAQLEKQRQRKVFGAVANDLPSSSAVPTGKTGWGKIIAVGIDQPGCMSDAKKASEGGGITVIKSPAAGNNPNLLVEDKNNVAPSTPAKSPASALANVPVFTDDDVIDVGGFEEVRCGRNGKEERNRILREAQEAEQSGWDLEVDTCVRAPSPVLEQCAEIDDVPAAGQKKKSNWWKPWKKETPAPAPAPAKRPSVKEDTGAVTAITSFNDVPSTPPDFGGPNNAAKRNSPNNAANSARMPGLTQPDTRPKPGRRNRGDQEHSSAARSQVSSLMEDTVEWSNPGKKEPRRKESGEITSITSMGVVEDDEDKPKFSRPKRNLHSQRDVLPGCLGDEPEDVIGWD
jgi:hypothetical protein